MASLRAKTRAGSAWLPNQVVYGMDTSDPEPANWKPFGFEVDKIEAAKAETQKASVVKGAPQGQLAQAL